MSTNPNEGPAHEPLLGVIEAHVASERGAIELYRRLQSDLPDPVLSTIMRLIVEDEEHHHRTLFSIAMALRSGWKESRAMVPRVEDSAAPSVLDETIAELERAADEEQAGAREFRALSRSEQRDADGVIALLLELMALDSDKHERMLRFVVAQIRAGIGSSTPGHPGAAERGVS